MSEDSERVGLSMLMGSRSLRRFPRGLLRGRARGLALIAVMILAAPAWAQTTPAPASPEAVQTPPPLPPAVVETVPPPPGPAYVWIAGHYAWRPHLRAYAWLPGHYTVPVAVNYVWAPGYWAVAPGGGYVWVEGHWRLR